ncbi:class F sortase [Streptomyces sp. SBST2-5]|uniref:Class F sortase n=1 Tax=Streptomyces composti TaxID=2720025 RepID=A0ABX1A382_9ACTN|nr:class F sortase [Streptomyces composti]NJP50725.1 class F sortase [Streptomyces composti]
MAGRERGGTGRLLSGVAWTVLLLGLWLWGREAGALPPGLTGAATGDMAAAGRPPETDLPPAHRPLAEAAPLRLDIPVLGVEAPVVARGLDDRGTLTPSPAADRPGMIAWYRDGVTPGASGTALLLGRTEVSTLERGQQLRVARADGGVAEFTVVSVRVLDSARADALPVSAPGSGERAGLHLVTCAGPADEPVDRCEPRAIASAYLTGATG